MDNNYTWGAEEPVSLHGATRYTFTISDAPSGQWHVSVAPPHHQAPADANLYPTLYVLDAPITFVIAAQTAWTTTAFSLGQMQPVAVVGIGPASDDPTDMVAHRTKNLTPTTYVPPHLEDKTPYGTGGADVMLDLIVHEIAPFLEARHPLDPKDRGIGGISLGGLVPCWALSTRPADFRRYLAVSPSLYWDHHLLLDAQRAPLAAAPDAHVYLAVGEHEEDPINGWPRPPANDPRFQAMADINMVSDVRRFAARLTESGIRSAPTSSPTRTTPPSGRPPSPAASSSCMGTKRCETFDRHRGSSTNPTSHHASRIKSDDDKLPCNQRDGTPQLKHPMTFADWPTAPRHPLPRTTPPFHYETVASYTARLAHINQLRPGELRRYLTPPRTRHPRSDWLATVSGYSSPVLQSRLKGLSHHERDLTRQRLRSRPACRFCMARRGVDEPVYCWLPEHVTVCYRHRRWIGPPARTWADQHSLGDRPAVVVASRRHGRLHRSNATFEFDLRDARRILAGWARAYRPSYELGTHFDAMQAHITAYPQIITLAGIFAAYRHRIWTSGGAKITLAQARNALRRDITRCFRIHDSLLQMPAMEAWVDEQIIAAARRT